jgi:hypothetical protein
MPRSNRLAWIGTVTVPHVVQVVRIVPVTSRV